MKYDTEQVRAVRDLATEYLGNGGLFNPELMRHDAVRDLVIECSAILDAWLASEYPKLQEDAALVEQILSRYTELFPNYAYTDSRCAIDLMAAEIVTLLAQ